MSVLLLRLPGDLAEAVITRLVAQDDEVRIIEMDSGAAPRWNAIGAHVARGLQLDSDLVERAALGVRTLVLSESGGLDLALLTEVLEGARLAAVDRLVVWTSHRREEVTRTLRETPVDFVHLYSKSSTLDGLRPSRLRHSVRDIAAAIDAADDISGNPALSLDLGAPEAWAVLGLAPPNR